MTDLTNAVEVGDIKAVKALLQDGTPVDERDFVGNTALIIASYEDKIEIAKLLLEKGADVSAENNSGETALRWVRDYSPMKGLLEAAVLKQNGEAPAAISLCDAVNNDDIESVKYLLQHDADVNETDSGGNRALLLAVWGRKTDIVRVLINEGADLTDALHILAAYSGDTEIARLLIDAHADINAKNEAGKTAILVAAFFGHVELTQLLINSGAVLDIKDNQGNTAQGLAADNGYGEVVQLLQRAAEDRLRAAQAAEMAVEMAAAAQKECLRHTYVVKKQDRLRPRTKVTPKPGGLS